MLAREVLVSRGTIALLALIIALDVFARTLLPLGIATSPKRAEELGPELRLLLFASLALLALLRAARWRTALRGFGEFDKAVIVVISGLYLQFLSGIIAVVPGWLLFRACSGADLGAVGEAIWLSSLAGILSLGRHAPRTLGLAFLLLAWWVPILGRLGLADPLAPASGIPGPAWSAEGILPMLVPHLLALGYVCLERAQR